MSEKVRQFIYFTLFCLLILCFIILLIFTMDSKKIKDVSDFIKTETKILYITSDMEKKYPVEILEKYNIEYLKINSEELSIFERKKLKEIIDDENLKDIIVVFMGGKVIDKLIQYKSEKDVNEFFQLHGIIPENLVDNVKSIMDSAYSMLDSAYSMIYIPYKEHDEVEKQNSYFEEISEDYFIDYIRINAYYLSSKQQEIINNMLKISLVEDQILILVKDGKVINNIRGTHRKNTFIQNLYDFNFINELEDKIEKVEYDELEDKINTTGKHILLIGSDSSKDSESVYSVLNEMIYNYELNVMYINVEKEQSEKFNELKDKIEDLGYDSAFSIPLVLIIESNKVLDYAIGNSKEEYFVNIFTENGVIKGDVVNE